MSSTATISEKNVQIWHDTATFPDIVPGYFDVDFWRELGVLTGSATGRGTTHFFEINGTEYVLRHYRRGGLIGKAINDQYVYTGLTKTRPWQEVRLLQHMQSLGLPAPKAVGARVKTSGLVYRADLITMKIPHAVDVHHILLDRALSADLWQHIGHTIARFHQHQIYHHDLNIHNIMLDNDHKAWLIDFDKCAIKRGDKWKVSNLDRLLRSLRKEMKKQPYHYSDSDDWQCLMKGYNGR